MTATSADDAKPAVERERHASWLELFFDLLFVAIVAQLAHGLVGHATPTRVLQVTGLFLPCWWAWVSFTYFSNIREQEGPAHRIWVLATMACLVVMGGGVGGALHAHPAWFAFGAGLVRVLRPVHWYVATRGAVGWMALIPYLASAVLWLGSAAVPPPGCYGMWAVAMALEVAPSLRRATAQPSRSARDTEHMVERFGLFVIIVLGEGITQILTALGAAAEPRAAAVLTGLAAFVLLAVVWWLYFDFASAAALAVMHTRADEAYRLMRDGLAFGHFLLVGSLVVIAAGLGEAVSTASKGMHDTTATALVCGGLLTYLLNNAVVGVAVIRQPVRTVLAWLAPDAAAVLVVWVLTKQITAGWAFALLATVLAAIAGRAVLTRSTLQHHAADSPSPARSTSSAEPVGAPRDSAADPHAR